MSGTDDKLFVTDAELIRQLGVGEKTGRKALLNFEKQGLIPRRDEAFGNKRYWPAVKAFLDRRSGLKVDEPVKTPVFQENFDD